MSKSGSLQNFLFKLALVAAVCATYAGVYPNAFILDDQALIITNFYLRDWRHIPDIFTHLNYDGSGLHMGFYRPVPMLLHLLVFQLFGLSTAAFHTLNIALQCLNVLLVQRLGKKLGFGAAASFAAALLWGVHPLHIEAVTYMAATPEILSATFTLLSLIVLLPDFSPRKILLALPLFLLALGCKESAVVLPALAVACLFVVSKNRLRPETYLKTWPFWVVPIIYTGLYFTLNDFRQYAVQDETSANYAGHILTRLFTSLATLPEYLGLLLYPASLHPERYFPVYDSLFSWPVLAGAALAAAALLQIVLGKGRRGVALSFGFFWFAAALSPSTGILIPIDALIAEHWMYVPGIGLFLGAAESIGSQLNKRFLPLAAAAVAVAAALLAHKTYRQNKAWYSPVTFYENVEENGGYMTRAYPDLGIYFLNARDFDKAAYFFKLALENADGRSVPVAALHAQLALAYLKVGSDETYLIHPEMILRALPYATQIPEAVAEFNKALEADPDYAFARSSLELIKNWEASP